MLEFRRARGADFEGMVELQDLYLAANLQPDQKRDGFLSARFSAEQFAAMDPDLCLVVGVDNDRVKAFLCSSTPEYNMDFALPRTLVERFPHVTFEGKLLSEWKTCICGPACVDREWRGKGIVERLYEKCFELLPTDYELAVIFVSTDNPRSIRAHEKLGMVVLDNFVFNERDFVIMGCRIRKLFV